jgi:hypothetical protein
VRRGVFWEEAVWNNVENFLRKSGDVFERLRQKITARSTDQLPEFHSRSLEIALEPKVKSGHGSSGCSVKGG